jgi:hypothetical protein
MKRVSMRISTQTFQTFSMGLLKWLQSKGVLTKTVKAPQLQGRRPIKLGVKKPNSYEIVCVLKYNDTAIRQFTVIEKGYSRDKVAEKVEGCFTVEVNKIFRKSKA